MPGVARVREDCADGPSPSDPFPGAGDVGHAGIRQPAAGRARRHIAPREDDRLAVDATSSRMVPVRLRIDAGVTAAGTYPIVFVVSAEGRDAVAVREKSVFVVR